MDYSVEASLFAEDLMQFIFDKRGLNYVPRHETEKYGEHTTGRSPFRLIMGNAVRIGIEDNVHELSILFEQIFKSKLDTASFRSEIIKLLPDWFPEGCHPICLIEFCVMVVSVAVFYHEAGCHHLSSCAGEVIAAVLAGYMMTGEFKQTGGWEKLVKLSAELVILDSQTKFGLGK